MSDADVVPSNLRFEGHQNNKDILMVREALEAIPARVYHDAGYVKSLAIEAWDRLVARLAEAEREKDEYRIEADCAMREYEALELSVSQAVDALRTPNAAAKVKDALTFLDETLAGGRWEATEHPSDVPTAQSSENLERTGE